MTFRICKEVLDAHAQFGGDLESMQKLYEYDGLERDAQRYRYLRDNHARIWSGVGGKGYSVDISFEGSGDDLGAAIDEVMKLEGY